MVGQEVKSRQDPCGFSKNIKVNLNNDVLKEKFLTRIKTLTETIRLVSEKEYIEFFNFIFRDFFHII